MTDAKAPEVTERKTRELCGQQRDNLRCIRSKGHAHEHAAFSLLELVTWNVER